MSSKLDRVLLNGSALDTVWAGARDASEADKTPPADGQGPSLPPAPLQPSSPPILTLDDEPPVTDDFRVSQSMLLMAAMFNAIFNMRYAPRAGDCGVMPLERDDGTYGMGLHPAEPELEEDGSMDIYSDPDFYNAARNFLSDLEQFTVGTQASIHLDSVGFLAPTKMDLFSLLSNYVSDEEFALSTPDTIYVKDDLFDKDRAIARQQRVAMRNDHAAKMQEKIAEGIDPAEVLYPVNNSPYSSMEDFHAACYACSFADLPIALAHIYQTICQEEGLSTDAYPQAKIGLKLTHGGYN